MSRKEIRLALVGVGNCAASLTQGIELYKNAAIAEKIGGLMHFNMGGYEPGDIKISTAQPQGPLIAIMLDPRSSNSLYQEPSWRALLLSNPLPTAPLIEQGQSLAKDQDKKAQGHGQG